MDSSQDSAQTSASGTGLALAVSVTLLFSTGCPITGTTLPSPRLTACGPVPDNARNPGLSEPLFLRTRDYPAPVSVCVEEDEAGARHAKTPFQLTGKLRSNNLNQFPCITAAMSSSPYPHRRTKPGILKAQIHDRRHLPSHFRSSLRLSMPSSASGSPPAGSWRGRSAAPDGNQDLFRPPPLRYGLAGDTHDSGLFFLWAVRLNCHVR